MNKNLEGKWDFIIIGAGICGLSLGALLINDGYKVIILEKRKNVGGRALVIKRDGFILDYGIHTVRFGKKSSLAKTLKKIKEKKDSKIKFKELGTSYFYLESGDNPHWEVLPTGLTGITKGEYFSISHLKNVLFKLMMTKKKKNLAISVKDWERKKQLNEEGKLYLKLITGSMQVCPFLERASIGELRRNLAEVMKKRISVTYPIGGWKLIFERLQKRIIENGGKILTSHEVDDIIIKDKKAIGVKCNNRVFQANNIIIAVPVQEIFSFLNKEFCTPEFVDLCTNLRATGGLSLDLALNKIISNETGLFYIDNPLSFGFFTSNIDKNCAPKGKQLFTICTPCNIEDLENELFRKELLAKLKGKLFQSFPKMKESIEFERPLFTIFDGVEVNVDQYQEKRPKFQVPGIKNLYLVGDSTAAPGAGGDIGHNSVWSVYRLIKNEYSL
ncbi:MAG: phytoene desaturase family protein [Promethearchaeota archaeon]